MTLVKKAENDLSRLNSRTEEVVSSRVDDLPPLHERPYRLDSIVKEATESDKRAASGLAKVAQQSLPPEPPTRVVFRSKSGKDARLMETIDASQLVGRDNQLGTVKMTIYYDDLRTRLSITIHEAR